MKRLLAIVFLVAGCAASTMSPAPTTTPSSTLVGGPTNPSQSLEVDPFRGLPYTMELPDGWFGGGPDTFAEERRAFESANPELAQSVKEMSPPVGDVFVGRSRDGAITLSANSLAAGAGWSSEAAILDESERQNLEAIASLPSTIGKPEADRVTLPAGEAVRIRWTSSVADPRHGSASESADVGYALTDGVTIVVVVFGLRGFDGSPDQAAQVEHIMETFQIRP